MQRQALNEEGEFITAGSLMLEPGPDDTPPPPIFPSGCTLGSIQVFAGCYFPGKEIQNWLRGDA